MTAQSMGCVLGVLLLLWLPGCDKKGKAGDPCQAHTECGEGLVCGKDKTCQSAVSDSTAAPTASDSAAASVGVIPKEVPFCRLDQVICELGDFEGCTKQCEAGKAVACRQLWRWYGFDTQTAAEHDEKKKEEFQKRQVELDEAACKKGEPCACSRLFDNYAKGHGVERNAQNAVARAQSACDAGDPGACEALGDVYLNGMPVDVGKDVSKAKKQYARAAALRSAACEKDKLAHCAMLGTMYVGGVGVKRSAEQGISLARKACSGGEPLGCMVLGSWYRSGRPDIQKNPRSARDAYQRACQLSWEEGCIEAKKVESENPAG